MMSCTVKSYGLEIWTIVLMQRMKTHGHWLTKVPGSVFFRKTRYWRFHKSCFIRSVISLPLILPSLQWQQCSARAFFSHDFQLRFEDVLLSLFVWAAEAWTKSRACLWRLAWKPHLLSTNLQIYHQFRWVLRQRYTTWCQATHTCLVNWNHSLTTKFMTIVGLGAWYTPILLLFYVPFSIEC